MLRKILNVLLNILFYGLLIILVLGAIMMALMPDNNIYVDIQNQCVVRKNMFRFDAQIYRLEIYNKEKSSDFYIQGSSDCLSKRFYLADVYENIHEKNKGYRFKDSTETTLLPNMEYEVRSMSNGDASASYLHFKTDSVGKVIWSDKTKPNSKGIRCW